MVDSLPYLTDTAAVLGTFKSQLEDFEVEELPRISPEGIGDHCWAWIEKRNLTTKEAANRIAHALNLPVREIGWAGMKDRYALTRQWLSIPGVKLEQLRNLDIPGLRVIDAAYHCRKLKTGTLRGNRFRLHVRDIPSQAISVIRDAFQVVLERGAPNYFGPQRFGRDGDNVDRARAWLIEGGHAPRDRFRRRLFVSAFQSAGFNEYVSKRIHEKTFDRALFGDVLRKEDTGGIFLCANPEEDQSRIETWEISPTGPMFGKKMRRAQNDAGRFEEKLEQSMGFNQEVYQKMGKLGQGTRRPIRIRPQNASIHAKESTVFLEFELPAGAYASVILRELFKEGLRDASVEYS